MDQLAINAFLIAKLPCNYLFQYCQPSCKLNNLLTHNYFLNHFMQNHRDVTDEINSSKSFIK